MSEPTAAERAKSIIAASASLTLTCAGRRAHLVDRHSLDPTGHFALRVPPDSAMGRQVTTADDLAAMIELTDLAPIAMRHRQRGQLVIIGGLSASTAPPPSGSADRVLWFVPVMARLTDEPDRAAVDIEADVLAATAPDPIADQEADLLCHLVGRHPEAIDRLARLLPDRDLLGVQAVIPLRLDRFGIVLRLQWPGRDRDARVPFREPIGHPDEIADRMRDLLDAATCRRRHSRRQR